MRLRAGAFNLVLLGLLSACACARPQASTGTPTRRAAQESQRPLAERLELATARGREIYRRDMLGWWASDLLLAQFAPEQLAGVGAWLVDAEDPSAVHFTSGASTAILVHCDGSGPEGCEGAATSSPLSDRNRAQLRAVETAKGHPEFMPTSDRYNHVVMAADDGRWWVYLIAATIDPSLVMLGRHYRYLVSAEGDEVIEWRAFSKSAVVISPTQIEGAVTDEFVVTHLLDDIPTEMHVWAALNYQTAIVVIIDDGTLWRVSADGSIVGIE